MKSLRRLGVYTVICTSFFFASFLYPHLASPVAAQQTATPTKTISEYETKGLGLFQAQLAALNEKKANPNAPGTVTVDPANIDALIKVITDASNVFKTNLTTGTGEPSARYTQALNTAVTYISEEQRKDSQNLRTPYSTNVIRIFTKQLTDEAFAERSAAGLREGGYTKEEIDQLVNDRETTSATAVNNVTAAKEAPPSKCTIFNWTIVSCIDAAVTWIIKNTLLQIAGFLVWLSANLFNYAIQLGILGFSEWSPSSLYEIWIVVRDIVSLLVVFAGLYLGFMYIIGREDTFGKYVGWLVLFALFVNFSYPMTRVLVDVSNIISLNVYASAVGSDALTTNFTTAAGQSGGNTAGAIIMNRLGLQGLVASATSVETGNTGFVGSINSTPGALMAVVFVVYAAYVLFMSASIIIARTAILSFIIIASPFLLLDSVIPKVGEAAMRLRKIFFEQLAAAPVFMVMLALTLKFMEVFQAGPLGQVNNTLSTLGGGGAESVKTFFNILMMLIMLHITLKVTRHLAGEAGNYATNLMGKVGGFGLGVATGGAGLLARGSIGMAAARMRDSSWMNKMQGSRTGRTLYGLSNSLAQSTFDARNIGMVQSGMAKAGITGGLGITMQQGIKQNYDQRFAEKDKEMKQKYSSIRDANAREGYIAQKTGGIGSIAQRAGLTALKPLGINQKDRLSDAQKTALDIRRDEREKISKYQGMKDGDKKKEYFDSLPKNLQEQIKKQESAQATQKAPEFKETVSDDIKKAPTEEVAENMQVTKETDNTARGKIDEEHPGGSDMSNADGPKPSGPGGSNTAQYNDAAYTVPAYQRKAKAGEATEAREMTQGEVSTAASGFDVRVRSAVDLARLRSRKSEAANNSSTTKPSNEPPLSKAA